MDTRVTTIVLNEPNLPRLMLADQTAVREDQFVSVVLRILNRLYPNCYVFRFAPTIVNIGVPWKPDVALVAHDFSYWFVIEVEIDTHSLDKHVLPQVIGLRDGIYDTDATNLISRSTGLPPDSAATFVKFVPRYTAVVSNVENDVWQEKLKAIYVQFISIAEFVQSGGPQAYLIRGLLQPAERSLGMGQVLANQQVIRLSALNAWKTGEYQIVDGTGVSIWDCQVIDRIPWIYKRRGLILQADRSWVQFIAQENELLSMRTL